MSDTGDRNIPQNRRRTDKGNASADAVRPRALAVDDDTSYLRLLERQLSNLGFATTSATGGAEAVDLCRENDFDVLVLDLHMPEMDGFDAFDRIRAMREQPYSILLTANDALETRIAAFSRGFDDFISKKAGPEEMVAKLNAAQRMLSIQRRLKDENSELMQLAITDQLTGLSNRLYLFSRARALSATKVRLNVVVFDIEQFTDVNDTYGNLFGDRILADIGALFRRSTRSTDVISRLGGDEFVLLVPEIDESEARQVAARIASSIEQLQWRVSGDVVSVRCNWGMSSASGREKSLPEILAECDRNLQEHKSSRAGQER